MRAAFVLVPIILSLAACEGPAEKAGKARDKAEAAASGQAYAGNGPNERLGAAQDKAQQAADAARAAEVKALRRQGDTLKTQADIAAEKLEQQADALRKGAAARSAALQQQSTAAGR